MSDVFFHNINFLLDKSKMTGHGLADKLGMESSTVYRWLDPKTKSVPRARARVQVAELFGVDPVDLVETRFNDDTVVNLNTRKRTNSVLNKKVKGMPIPHMESTWALELMALVDDDAGVAPDDLSPSALEWLPPAPVAEVNKRTPIVVTAENNAMAPDIRKGDLVYVEFNFGFDKKDTQWAEGDLVLAKPYIADEDGGPHPAAPVIRKLVYGDNEKDQWLTATNPEFPGTRMVKAYTILGKVIAIFRQLPA